MGTGVRAGDVCVSALLLLVLLLLLVAKLAMALSVDPDTGRPRPADLANMSRDILQGLGLERVPDVAKANISQEEWSRMTQLYLERVAARRGESQQKLYTFHSTGAPSRGRRSPQAEGRRRSPPPIRLRYPINIPQDAEMDQAELRVFVRQPGSLRLYEVSGGRRVLLSRGVVGTSGAGWTQLDVTEAARAAQEEGRPLQLELRCAAGAGAADGCEEPALNVIAAPTHLRAKRASVGRADCGKDGHRCCRHAMEVEFSQLPGMEFILQPKRFDAGFCRGRCPPRFHPAHHHALIQGLVRQAAPPPGRRDRRRVPRPCCAPANLQPLDILFVDEDDPTKLKVQVWSDMRVMDCACA